MRKLILVIGIVLFVSLNAMAVKQPHIITPDPHDVSLRPLVVWTPIEDADSYSVKLKEINTATGLSTTIETVSVAAPATSYRPTVTLTAGNFYVFIIRAVDGAEQSDKEKLYFQAKDKFIVIGHTQFAANGDDPVLYDDFNRAGLLMDTNTINEGTSLFITGASFSLSDEAIITGFSITLIDNNANSTIAILVKSEFGGNFQIIGSGTESITTADADPAARTFSVAFDLTDTTTLTEVTVTNDVAHYQVDVDLGVGHELDRAIVRYID